jgi:predicted ATPase
VEAIAEAIGEALAPVLSATKPRTGCFLRAESFFNIVLEAPERYLRAALTDG